MEINIRQNSVTGLEEGKNWYASCALQRGRFTFYRYLRRDGWHEHAPLYSDKETIEKLAAVHENSFVPYVTTQEYKSEEEMERMERRLMERF